MSNTLQYRALLVGPGDKSADRPIQAYASDLPTIREWASKYLAIAVSPHSTVEVYESAEKLVYTIRKSTPLAQPTDPAASTPALHDKEKP